MKRYIRVYKEECIYTFEKNEENELFLYGDNIKDSEKSFIKNMGSNIEDISVYVEDNRNIYILFRQDEDLKCSILQDENINTGILYSYYSGNYRICNAYMFIEAGNINIIAILKNNSEKVQNVLIHYIYEEEAVRKNVLRSLSKGLKNKYCVIDNCLEEIGVYYVDKMFSKNYIFYRGYKSRRWSDEKKLFDVHGDILCLDVKKRDANIILAMVEHVASIWSVRIVVLDDQFKIVRQKIHHSVYEIENIDIVEQGEAYVVWQENGDVFTTTTLSSVSNIDVLKLNNMNFDICECYRVEKFCVKCKKELLIREENGHMESIDLRKVIEDKINEIDSGTTKNIDEQTSFEGNEQNFCKEFNKESSEEIKRTVETNIEKLKNDIINKQNLLMDKIKECHVEQDAIENYISELNIMRAQKEKLEADMAESGRIIELYEQTIKNNYNIIEGKDRVIQDVEARIKEKEVIIEQLEEELQEESDKGFFKRLFRL